MIIVSSCMLGINTRYDRKSNSIGILEKFSSLCKFIPICPEQLGGLPTPRHPCEIICGSGEDVLNGSSIVTDIYGHDLTKEFLEGARQVQKIISLCHISAAILKERSPSCGCKEIYDGSFTHTIRYGQGVTSSMLRKLGIPLYSEDDITAELLEDILSR